MSTATKKARGAAPTGPRPHKLTADQFHTLKLLMRVAEMEKQAALARVEAASAEVDAYMRRIGLTGKKYAFNEQEGTATPVS